MDTFLYHTCGLVEPICDPDGYYNGRIAPPDQARILWWASWMGMFTGVVGILHGWRWAGAGVCIGSLIAQLYWSDPTFSWRRNLDLAWIQVLIWSHVYLAWASPVFWIYAAIQATGVAFYGASWYFIKQRKSWPGTLTHVGLHACANLSLLVLYCAGQM